MPQNVFQHILYTPDHGPHGDEICADQYYLPMAECEPTDDQPGTVGKLAVLADRVLRGEPLWHDDDRNCFDEGGPC